VAGYLVFGIFKFLLANALNPWQIIIRSSFERLAKAIRTVPRDVLIAQSMPKRKGAAFGLHRAMDTAGAVFGYVLVLFGRKKWTKGILSFLLSF